MISIRIEILPHYSFPSGRASLFLLGQSFLCLLAESPKGSIIVLQYFICMAAFKNPNFFSNVSFRKTLTFHYIWPFVHSPFFLLSFRRIPKCARQYLPELELLRTIQLKSLCRQNMRPHPPLRSYCRHRH